MRKASLKHNVDTFLVHGRTMVSGLFWQPHREGKGFRKEVLSFGKAQGFDLYVLNHHKLAAQAGYAPTGRHVKGYSLAAVLADVLGDSWIAAFEVGEGRYAMAAVHAGSIMAGSDLIGGYAEIKAAFQEFSSLVLSSSMEWGRVIAPESFEIGGVPTPIEAIFHAKQLRKEHRLRPVSIKLSPKQLAGIAVALSVICGGGWYGNKIVKARAEAERLAKIERAKQAALEEQALKEQEAIAAGPWSTRPTGQTLLTSCKGGWEQIPLVIAGWSFDNGRCETNLLTAIYRRTSAATVADFTSAVEGKFSPPIIRENGEVAALTFVAQMPITEERELPPIRNQVGSFLAHLQAFGVDVKLSDVKKPGVSEDAMPGTPEPVVPWHSHEFTMDVSIPPEQLFEGLNLKGMRINMIDLTLDHQTAEMKWSIKGDLYGK